METLEYIEEYFKGELDAEEKKRFEDSIRTDPAFANEVAYYISVRHAAKELAEEDRLARFRTLETGRMAAPANVFSIKKVWLAAAAIAVLAISLLVLFSGSSVSKDARQYVDAKFGNVGALMSGAADLTQQGIDAYNHQQYTTAREKFEQALKAEPSNSQVLQLAGLTAYQLKDYSAALGHFRTLAALPGLYSNPGPFLQAATLLTRNEGNDQQEARRLLDTVVQSNLYGKDEAERWLKKLD